MAPIDLSSVFNEQELTLLLEGLFAIQDQRKRALDSANTYVLATQRVELEPEDFGLVTLECLINRFAATAPQGPRLVIAKSNQKEGRTHEVPTQGRT